MLPWGPRRWDLLVRKPLAVGQYAISLKTAHEVLQPARMSPVLIDSIFYTFARQPQCSNSWCRGVGDAPELRADALELFAGLSLTCRATLKHRLSTLFSLFDSGDTGRIVEEDLGALISLCASFIHRLGLSPAITNDEAAFVAGGAFARSWDAEETSAGELDLPMFFAWACHAEWPVRALELLALPYHLSRTVSWVSAKVGWLRERYSAMDSAPMYSQTALRLFGGRSMHRYLSHRPTHRFLPRRGLVVTKLQDTSKIFGKLLFGLSPLLSGVSPHGANIVFEASSSGAQTLDRSICPVLVSVEECKGYSFFVVESQLIVLRGGQLAHLALSELRSASDYRVQFSWNKVVGFEGRMTEAWQDRAQDGTQRFRTIRFKTLPALSSSKLSSHKRVNLEVFSGGCASLKCIGVLCVGPCYPERKDDVSHRVPPLPCSKGSKRVCHNDIQKSVSVLVRYRRLNTLSSVDKSQRLEAWWATGVLPAGSTDNQLDFGVLPWTPQIEISAPQTINNDQSTVPTPRIAPFSGEGVRKGSKGVGQSQSSDQTITGSEVDIVIHLSPDWRAAEVIRRCFAVLEECQFESPTVKEEAKSIVSREALIAIRSLLGTSCQTGRSRLRDDGKRRSAQVVLGNVNPWLGLGEVRGLLLLLHVLSSSVAVI